jgi:1-acyl-sn-glycerol-3-phosphate acyltransferase
MIWLRSALFNVFFFAFSVVLCVLGYLLCLARPRATILVPMVWARVVLTGLRLICGIRLELEGREYLPNGGAALIASQHQSAFDTLVWLTLLPRCCYVLKAELRRIPLFGAMIAPAGMIVVDRKGGAAALRHLVRETERATREQRQIVIFPEGTRGEPGRTLPLQPGVAAMAARTGLPVIPVVTDSGRCWGRRAFRKRAGIIHIRLLPPIPASTSRDSLMTKLTGAFRAGLGKAVDNSVG